MMIIVDITYHVIGILAAMLVLSIILIALAKSYRVSLRASIYSPLIIAVNGVGVSILLWLLVGQADLQRVCETFESDTAEFGANIEYRLKNHLEIFYAFRSFDDVHEMISQEEFAKFTQPYLDRFTGLEVLAWSSFIPHEQRPSFESYLETIAAPTRFIRQIIPGEGPTKADDKETYAPIKYLAPLEGNEIALGMDFAASPDTWAVLKQARDENTPFATGPVQRLEQDNQEQRLAILAFFPIYQKNLPVDTKDERKNHLRGFVHAVLQLDNVMEQILMGNALNDQVDIVLYDHSAGKVESLLYRKYSDDPAIFDLAESHSIAFAGREWRLRLSPTMDYLKRHRAPHLIGVLFSGLLFTASLVGWLFMAQRRTRENEALFRELKESEGQLNDLYENAPIPYATTDLKEIRVLKSNRAFADLLGLDWRKTRGIALADYFMRDADEDCQARAIIDQICKGDKIMDLEVRLRRADGRFRWANISVTPIYDPDGKPIRTRFNIVDVTESHDTQADLAKARDVADQANKAKSDFLANMSHEIRTPMNAVIGLSQLALGTELTVKQRDYITKVNRSAQNLLGILNDILDFSKIEADKLELEHIDFDLAQLLDDISGVVGLRAAEKGLEFLYDIPPEIPTALIGDPLRLNQVLLNLLNNAVKFTEKGEITLQIEIVEEDKQEVGLQFKVRDTGIGLTKDQQAGLFKAFSQADSSTTRKYGGTGLGLTISRRLVNMMGGEISCHSNFGDGSTFTFTALFGKGIRGRNFVFPQGLDRLKVLVVDDNRVSRSILVRGIKAFSFKADEAVDGSDAIETFSKSEQGYDLVLMDYEMPGMNGIEAARRIKQLPGKNPKVMIVSAHGHDTLMEESEKVGLDGYLIKPVSQSTLYDAILSVFVAPDAEAEPVASPAKRASRLKGLKVLLVEDNEINQQVAKELLTAEGVTVTIADNGRQAIHLVEPGRFDGVLMDVQMPVMDGYEATRELRKFPALADLPILAMTANVMVGDREKALEAGMNDHISKPIDPTEMFTKIRRWMRPTNIMVSSTETPTRPMEQVPVDLRPYPGINVVEGLERMAGNAQSYMKILRQFRRNNLQTSERLRSLIGEKDMDTTMRLAHTVKGVAGTIGAYELQEAAGKIEEAVRTSGQEVTQDMITRFCAALDEVVDGLAPLDEKRTVKVVATDQADPAIVKPLLMEMVDLIESDLSRANEKLEKLSGLLANTNLAESCAQIEDALASFDTDEAQQLIEKMLKQLAKQEANP